MNPPPPVGTPEWHEYTTRLRGDLEAVYRRQREAEANARERIDALAVKALKRHQERQAAKRLADRRAAYYANHEAEKAAARARMRRLKAERAAAAAAKSKAGRRTR